MVGEVSKQEAGRRLPGKSIVIVRASGGDIETKARYLLKIPFFEALLLRWHHHEEQQDAATTTGSSSTIDKPTPTVVEVKMDAGALNLVLNVHRQSSSSPSRLLKALPRTCSASDVMELAELLEIDIPFAHTDVNNEKFLKISRKLRLYKNTRNNKNTVDKEKTRKDSENAASALCLSLATNRLNLLDRTVDKQVKTDVLYILSHAKTFDPDIAFTFGTRINRSAPRLPPCS